MNYYCCITEENKTQVISHCNRMLKYNIELAICAFLVLTNKPLTISAFLDVSLFQTNDLFESLFLCHCTTRKLYLLILKEELKSREMLSLSKQNNQEAHSKNVSFCFF
jgi:hypothetical protein